MHTWAKRGLQTAVVTGGLFAIGSGIASASENVTPAAPAELTGTVTSVAGNTVSGVIGQAADGETPVKAVPVVSLFDSGAMSAPVKTVQDALGRVTAKADPADFTEIHGFSGDLLNPAPGLPSVQSRPSTQALGLPALPGTPALPVLPAVGTGGLSGLEHTLPLGNLTAGTPVATGRALAAPVLAQVTRTVLNSGGVPDTSALDMPLGSIGLLRATELPSLPGGMTEQDAPALPAVPAIPSVPAGLPVNLPKPNVQLPEVSGLRGELPVNALSGALPGAPSEQDLPTAGLPAVPAVPAVPGLAGVTLPSLPKVPALPAVPGRPAVQDGGIPNALALPNLPKVPFLPEAPELPAANAAATNFLAGIGDELPGV